MSIKRRLWCGLASVMAAAGSWFINPVRGWHILGLACIIIGWTLVGFNIGRIWDQS